MSKMMRISEELMRRLDSLVESSGQSRQTILNEALETYEHELFLKKTNEELVRYKKEDPQGYEDYMRESAEWDMALNDGFDDVSKN